MLLCVAVRHVARETSDEATLSLTRALMNLWNQKISSKLRASPPDGPKKIWNKAEKDETVFDTF